MKIVSDNFFFGKSGAKPLERKDEGFYNEIEEQNRPERLTRRSG
jgi:hypothetical protein